MRRDAWQRERPADLPSRFPRVWVAGLLLAAATLNVAPPEALGRLRGLFLDSLRPGQLLVQNLSDRVRPLREIASAGSPADPIHAFEARIRELELERERRRIQEEEERQRLEEERRILEDKRKREEEEKAAEYEELLAYAKEFVQKDPRVVAAIFKQWLQEDVEKGLA